MGWNAYTEVLRNVSGVAVYRPMTSRAVPLDQTDVIRGVAETLVIWVNACLAHCGPAPGEAPPSPRSSRLLPCYGGRQSTGGPSRAIARWGCTVGLDEPHSPVAGFYSTGRRAVGLEQPF